MRHNDASLTVPWVSLLLTRVGLLAVKAKTLIHNSNNNINLNNVLH